jgi:hypothetical protein
MSNYFTAYETKRKIYNKVQPRTVWRLNRDNNNITFTVKHIDLVNKLAWGIRSTVADGVSIISFEYLVKYYNLLKRGI